MDFELSDDQRAIADLAEQILGDKASHERLRELEKRGGPRFDAELWQDFAEAGLLGIAVPEAQGGAGLGFLELAVILEQIGRRTAPIPFLETAVLGVLPLAAFGSTEQQEAWLPGVVRGETRLSAALVADEAVRAERDGEGFRLTGTALFVPAAEFADAVLVAARLRGGRVALPGGDRGRGCEPRGARHHQWPARIAPRFGRGRRRASAWRGRAVRTGFASAPPRRSACWRWGSARRPWNSPPST